jgi:hypothetical protein
MPRPCAGEIHARGNKIRQKGFCRCHGLVPWRLTFDAEAQASISKSTKGESPRHKGRGHQFSHFTSRFNIECAQRSVDDRLQSTQISQVEISMHAIGALR